MSHSFSTRLLYMTLPLTVDDEWALFLTSGGTKLPGGNPAPYTPPTVPTPNGAMITGCLSPPPEIQLSISTQTKVLFLNRAIDIHAVFWDLPIIEYWRPVTGIVKKQMKMVCNTPEEYALYRQRVDSMLHVKEHVLKQIHTTTARGTKYKDERKITVGISKKDVVTQRQKVKNAFYNCFAMILRLFHLGVFREIHVKVFNTGKMEIPGVADAGVLTLTKEAVLGILRPLVGVTGGDGAEELAFLDNRDHDHVLINSNFTCGFPIHREAIHVLLSNKYGIESAYDPCSYPGVKCKYYFNTRLDFDHAQQTGRIDPEDRFMKLSELLTSKKYVEVSFMIFRTGKGLIVGNCTERILRFVFEFIRKVLVDEHADGGLRHVAKV